MGKMELPPPLNLKGPKGLTDVVMLDKSGTKLSDTPSIILLINRVKSFTVKAKKSNFWYKFLVPSTSVVKLKLWLPFLSFGVKVYM